MLLLTKLAALAVIIWFYMTAEKNGQPTVKWALIGLVGYIITWFLVDFILDSAFSSASPKKAGGMFMLGQIPAIAGLAAAYLIRKKLLGDINKPS
jgi:uncharacterized membrane protein